MSALEEDSFRIHEDADLFQQALRVTLEKTGFLPRLIEKDYFCSLLLAYLGRAVPALVFKGGTCLAKVHAGFFRLSEDLDFSIPMPVDASRSQRGKVAEPLKAALAALPERVPCFRLVEKCRGANNSTQYMAVVGYHSPTGERDETIEVEAGLREPLLTPPSASQAQTLLLDPVTGQALLPAANLTCLSKVEAYAEKFRAALSRREAAIRDFYDLDHAVREAHVDPRTSQLTDLVRQKLAVHGNEAVDVSPERLAVLRRQIETELLPVLREIDFVRFDLERAFDLVRDMASRIM